jgi:PKD repeat protein
VYRNPSSGPVDGEAVFTTNGTYAMPGYHVINLTSPVPFIKSDRYSIVIHLINDDYIYVLPLQYVPCIAGPYNPPIYPGDSYYSLDGVVWNDSRSMFGDNSTNCIKGYMRYSPQLHTITATADSFTSIIPRGTGTYTEGENKTYLTQAKPGSDLLNVTVDSRSLGPNATWTFINISQDHNISTSGGYTPGQVHALFTVNQTWGPVPMAVRCTDQSVGSPTSFYWQFGDGSASTSQNPVHIYQTPGTYDITLKATNNQSGGVAVYDNAITVTSGIVSRPTSTPVRGKIPAALPESRCVDLRRLTSHSRISPQVIR